MEDARIVELYWARSEKRLPKHRKSTENTAMPSPIMFSPTMRMQMKA